MMAAEEHQPVMLDEVIAGLALKPDGVYVDGTFGRGGHSQAILERLSEQGRLIGIDKDPEAVAVAKQRFGGDPRFECVQGSFAMMEAIASQRDLVGKVDGVLLDLGVSSPQLDDPERGFSFLRSGPLDMRMDPSRGQSAADWLASASADEIADVLWEYGEERFSRRIARAVVKKREEELPLTTTKQLAEVIARAHPSWDHKKHPATRSFQAIRIFINNELGDLALVLQQILGLLAPSGRLAAISFHSLEDRIVKRFMAKQSKAPELPRGLPIKAKEQAVQFRRVGKAVRATEEEIAVNPRARSATLRIMEKIE